MLSASSSDGGCSPVSSSSGFISTNSNNLEDQRALKLAFELSMAGLTEVSLNNIKHFSNGNLGLTNFEEKYKKSQNMTECVPVPSSEHVAEIVGRQGCKIKALRAKTNTYIKTPVRGEEPVFVVTGRKEDVNKAKLEIISAAEHFSLIRASRKPLFTNQFKESISLSQTQSNDFLPKTLTANNHYTSTASGQITIQVRVPYRVVGLVVGPKGATIKNIQHETQTYIVTPSRDKEPVFEVTGLSENVQCARKQIESHIALRTGQYSNTIGSDNNQSSAITLCSEDFFLSNLYKSSVLDTLNEMGVTDRKSDLVNIWKNVESTERDISMISPICSNELIRIESSSGCSSSASTISSSSSTKGLSVKIENNDKTSNYRFFIA